MTSGTQWGVARMALVDFLRNDKWGVVGRGSQGVSGFPAK